MDKATPVKLICKICFEILHPLKENTCLIFVACKVCKNPKEVMLKPSGSPEFLKDTEAMIEPLIHFKENKPMDANKKTASADLATARPWMVDFGREIFAKGNNLAIAAVFDENSSDCTPVKPAEAKANAELIVRAVNSHEDLVNAAKIAQRHIEWLAEKELVGDKAMENLLQSVNAALKDALALAGVKS